jgi:hypothetical protein
MQILTKATYIISLAILLVLPGSADIAKVSSAEPSPTNDNFPYPQKTYDAPANQARTSIPVEGEILESPGDGLGGKERSHPELLQIAKQASVGNRDAVEISAGLYLKFGLRRDVIQEFIDRAQLHSGIDVLPPASPGVHP